VFRIASMTKSFTAAAILLLRDEGRLALDEPLDRQRTAVARLHEVHGSLPRDEAAETESDSPFHLAWWLFGQRGRVRVEMLLTPELPPRVQTSDLCSVPVPPAAVAALAGRIVDATDPRRLTEGSPVTAAVGIGPRQARGRRRR
jgi:hypothetical protein